MNNEQKNEGETNGNVQMTEEEERERLEELDAFSVCMFDQETLKRAIRDPNYVPLDLSYVFGMISEMEQKRSHIPSTDEKLTRNEEEKK
ncbi:hypothetical protein SNEBB_011311 [Seison nebaliae]|nr:hypothetical protein SNEBB_011311 [Seison nebaliae]